MNQAYLKNILSAKFDFDIWKDLLEKIFPKVEIFTSVAKIADSHVKDGGHVGNIRLDDGRSLAIFRFEVADNVQISRNRKSLRDIAAKYVDQGLIHGALVFYYSQGQDDYRLTFIAKQTYFNESGELVKKETAPKRYTFLLGKNEPCTTAASRLMELADKKSSGSVFLADVTDTFSVERLNKEFFKDYKKQYNLFLEEIGNTKQNRDYVKKLLGRLVFLQFLQKKGWMGVPASNENWEGGDKNYLANLIERYKGNDRILSDVLEPLFFDTLNKERVGDIADSRLGNNIKIPYLNGGLFDKDKIDALDIDFPYSYFEDLMKFFNEYNFTIDENDPDDAEVGVDPEMLGHIFENLLEDNKDKGAFYTPKEIVQYMCQQSVVQYLKTHTHSDLHNAIETLVINKQVDVALQEKDIATNIYNLLRNVKVCDPAIGSGAFPMGVLNVLFHSRQLLYGFRRDTKGFVPEEVKRDIIQNNIFGVDIEQGAVDIARLRFWLSLVVDSEEPNPLPNLDYKIMQGNSLIESFSGIDLSRIAGVKKKGKVSKSTQLILGLDSIDCEKNLQLLMKQYFSINDHAKKNDLRRDINYYVKGFLINSLGGTPSEIEHLERLDCSANEEFFLWHTWFKDVFDKGGFDIVIGNPPYGVSIKDGYRKAVVDIHGNVPDYEIYYYFIECANKILCKAGILSYIIPNTWLFNTYALKYRTQILESWNLIEVLDCTNFPIFKSATVRNTIITWTNKRASQNTIGYRNTSKALNFTDLLNEPKQFIEIFDLMQLNQNWGLAFSRPQDVIRLIRKISCNNQSLISIFPDISQGLIAYDKYRGQSEDVIKTRAYHHYEYRVGLKKWLWGEDIRRYEVNWNNKEYLDYCDGIANPRQPKFFMGKRLLVREITNPSIYATITSDELYNDPAVLIALDNDGKYPLEVVLAILNSKLATFYHFNHSPKATKGAFPKILVKDLKEFPLPAYNKEVFDKLEKDVNTILKSKKENPLADTSEIENQIDFIVYKLYGLTYDEVLIVDKETTIKREEYEKDL